MEFGAGDENVEMLLIDEENWQTDKGNPVRLCSQGESDRRLVVYGNRSWYETSRSDTLASEGGQPVGNIDQELLLFVILFVIMSPAFLR